MILPTSYAAALLLTIVSMICWGSWANTFKLTHVEGGGDWELVGAPASLKMSDHVGHKVEVSGMAVSAATAEKAEHMAGEKKEGKKEMKEEKGEHHLKVTPPVIYRLRRVLDSARAEPRTLRVLEDCPCASYLD